MLYAEVAFAAKAISTTYVQWMHTVDPEVPPGGFNGGGGGQEGSGGTIIDPEGNPSTQGSNDQAPSLVVNPPYQEIERGQTAGFSIVGTHTNPEGRNATVFFDLFDTHEQVQLQDININTWFFVGFSLLSPAGVYKARFRIVDDENVNNTTLIFEATVVVKATERTVYAVTEEGIAYVTFDTGEHWTPYDIRVEKGIPGLALRCVAADPYNRFIAWFGDSDGRVWRTETGLSNVTDYLVWVPSSIESIAVDPYTTNVIFFGGNNGKLYRMQAHGFPYQADVPDVVKDIEVPISIVAISPVNSNRIAVGGQDRLWVSNNYGKTWTQVVGFTGDITDAQYSKINPNILLVSTSFNSFAVNVLSGHVASNTDANSVYHPSISSIPGSHDGAIHSILAEHAGATQDWLFKSSPLGPTTGLRPSLATYPDNIQVEKSYEDRIWYSNASYLFRSYQIGGSYEAGTYAVLYASGTVNDLDQGPLVGSDEQNAQFEVPVIP